MRVAGSIFTGLAVFAVLAGARAGAETQLDDAKRNQPSVVIVSSHMGYHRDAIGAGVVVGLGPYTIRIVTARHVTEHGDVTIWIAGNGYPADVVRTFAHRDLAVVDAIVPRSARTHVTAAEVAASATNDDPIVVWGEDDAGPRMERGRIVATRFIAPGDADAPPLLNIECQRCARGDSGGGIFAIDGRLIGILVARFHTSDNRTVATVGEIVDPALFASPEAEDQATASTPAASTVRSQNDPKLSPG